MSHALYYPSIEFRDPDFVKKSLLVWDRIFRVVPPKYVPRDDAAVAIAAAAGLVVDLNVDEKEKAKAAKGFLDFYAVRRESHKLTWPAGLDSETFVRINPEKIEARLLPLFENLSRAMNLDGFLEIPADLAGGYMFYLAEAVAKQRSLALLTDSPDTWAVGSYFAQGGNFSEQIYNEKADAYLCNLALTDLLPDEMSHLTMEEVLRFVDDHREERAIFQRELERLRIEISRCNNKSHARYIVFDFIKAYQRAKDDYRKAIGPFSKREFCCIFSAGLAATMGFLSLPVAAVADAYVPVRIGIGVLIGAVSALASRGLIPHDKGRASYLVSVEQLSATPSTQLHRTFEEFVND